MHNRRSPSIKLALALAGLLLVGLALAVGWLALSAGLDLFPRVDLRDGTREQARDLGFTLPEGASRVYIKARQAMDVSSRHVRFDLPKERFLAYHLRLARQPGARMAADLQVPAAWPTFEAFAGDDFTVPAWWTEQHQVRSRVVVLLQRPHGTGSGGDGGTARGGSFSRGQHWVLDMQRYRVYLWAWSWQWWDLAPDAGPPDGP